MSIRLAVLTDFAEEGWHSMDLCGDMLLHHLPRGGPLALDAERLRPPFRRVAARLPILGRRGEAFNADRLLNRFALFPRHARRWAAQFDLFHVADHSYGQLVHALPAGRTGIYCHDLDAFRCLLEPGREPRPRWFRALARRILTGMSRAALVFYGTAAVGEELGRAGVVPSDRLVFAPYGVAPEFSPGPTPTPTPAPAWLAAVAGRPWILHVGSCIPRKRVDVLLGAVAATRRTVPDLRLVKIGGSWSTDHREQIARLGLDGSIVHLRGLDRDQLAEAYRRAGVVLVPSSAEGFGLPVVEALACGARVVASDIPALREAGGPIAKFVPVGDVARWAEAATAALTTPDPPAARAARLAWAARFSWADQARIIAGAYRRLL